MYRGLVGGGGLQISLGLSCKDTSTPDVAAGVSAGQMGQQMQNHTGAVVIHVP